MVTVPKIQQTKQLQEEVKQKKLEAENFLKDIVKQFKKKKQEPHTVNRSEITRVSH